MHEIPGATPHDVPEPPSPDEVAARFGRPIIGFCPQPHLTELNGLSTMGHNDRLVQVAVSYSFLLDPADPSSPQNLVDDVESVHGWIEKAHRDRQPEWFIRSLQSRSFPMLWEAVRTSVDEFERTPAEGLARHVNHVLINTVENRRRRSADSPAPRLDAAVPASHAQPATVTLDGIERDGVMIDTDPDIVGWAAEVDGAIVSIAIDRDRAAVLDLRLVTRWVPPASI